MTEIQLLEIVKGNLFVRGKHCSHRLECLILHSIKVYFVGMCLKNFSDVNTLLCCHVYFSFRQWKEKRK